MGLDWLSKQAVRSLIMRKNLKSTDLKELKTSFASLNSRFSMG
jgi:hypothetical protein